jgi:peptidyl-prolyl cis-trans isomerase A (cyclophilin A)
MVFRVSVPAVVAACVSVLVVGVGSVYGGQTTEAGALLAPSKFTERAPDKYSAQFDTSKGAFVVEVNRQLSPNAADRFYNMVKSGYYNGNKFFYVNDRVAMWGVNGNPATAQAWLGSKIGNDPLPPKQSNLRGWIALSFSNGMAAQTMVHRVDNKEFDTQTTPFGKVVSGIEVIDRLYAGYGEIYPTGKAPSMAHLMQGNTFLEQHWKQLDYIKTATIVP